MIFKEVVLEFICKILLFLFIPTIIKSISISYTSLLIFTVQKYGLTWIFELKTYPIYVQILKEKKKKKLMTKLINRRFPILYTILFYKSWWRGYKVVNYKKGNRRRPCAGVSHPQKKKAKAFSILIISINRSIPDVKSSVN